MSDLFMFDDSDNLLCLLSNEGRNSCNFWDAIYDADLKGTRLFEFKTLADHNSSEHIKELNYVGFYDRENKYRLFKIESVAYESDGSGDYIQVYARSAMLELLNTIIEERRPQNRNIEYMLGIALEGTRYRVGNCAPLGEKSTSFFFLNGIECINQIANLFGAEVEERIEHDGQRIIGRYIDMPSRLGVDTGKTLELTKDVMSMSKVVSTAHMATALFGRGSSLEQEREDEETGETIESHSRKIDFADVVWRKGVDGAPLDKPRGQRFLEDPEATALLGLPHEGIKIALYDISSHENQQDPEQLLWDTYFDLQRRTQRFYNFEMSIILLGDLIGYEAHKLHLGDTVRAVNHRFKNPIATETRIIRIVYDVADPNATADVELGHFVNLYTDDDRLDKLEDQINIIGSRPPQISDHNVSNVRPTQVTGLDALDGFDAIHLFWDNQGLVVRDFELHASEVQGFTPSSENRIYRGRANMFSHLVETNQQYFYRCRATNHHEVAGDWSLEVSARTANTKKLDDLEGDLDDLKKALTENDEKLDGVRDIMDKWEYEDTVEIDGGKIRADTIIAKSIATGTITALEIASDAVVSNKIQAGAIVARHISADQITANAIDTNAILARHITAGAIVADKIAAGAIRATHIQAGAITGDHIQGRLLQGVTLQSSSGNNMVRISNGRVDVHFQGQANNIGMRLDQGTMRIMNSGIPPSSMVVPPNGELAGFTRLHNTQFTSIIGSAIVTRGSNNGMVFRLASQGHEGWGFSRSHIQTTNNSAGTTQIWGASAMSEILMNNHPLKGMTAFNGDGDVDIRKEKALRARKIGTTNFTGNAEMALVAYVVDGEKGMLMCNKYPNPKGGFWIGENGSTGIMINGSVQITKGGKVNA